MTTNTSSPLPYRLKLEESQVRLCLDERIDITGMVPHFRVASVLNEADIFLNTALTEAFCIAIVEAARMGLLTDVFGRITFNGRFYQALILQVLIGFTRSHSIWDMLLLC